MVCVYLSGFCIGNPMKKRRFYLNIFIFWGVCTTGDMYIGQWGLRLMSKMFVSNTHHSPNPGLTHSNMASHANHCLPLSDNVRNLHNFYHMYMQLSIGRMSTRPCKNIIFRFLWGEGDGLGLRRCLRCLISPQFKYIDRRISHLQSKGL